MKRSLWAPILAIGAAILVLVPSTFAVGEPSAEQQKSPGNVVTGEDGQRIKVMPANGQ